METLRSAPVSHKKDEIFRAESDNAVEQQPPSAVYHSAPFLRRPRAHAVCDWPDPVRDGHQREHCDGQRGLRGRRAASVEGHAEDHTEVTAYSREERLTTD